ncbi:hypothetical protein ACFL25_00370, partial [Patescibacteria group bacterium]
MKSKFLNGKLKQVLLYVVLAVAILFAVVMMDILNNGVVEVEAKGPPHQNTPCPGGSCDNPPGNSNADPCAN